MCVILNILFPSSFFHPFKIQNSKRKVSPFSRRFDYYSFKPPLLNIYTSPACFGSLKFLHTHRTRPLKKEKGKKKTKRISFCFSSSNRKENQRFSAYVERERIDSPPPPPYTRTAKTRDPYYYDFVCFFSYFGRFL